MNILPKKQFGFTLLESVIVLTLIAIFMSVSSVMFNSDKERAAQIIAKMEDVRNGLLRHAKDFPAGSLGLSGLVDLDGLNPAQFPGSTINSVDNWKGPYIEASKMNKAGGVAFIDLSSIAYGMELHKRVDQFAATSPSMPNGQQSVIYLELENVPDSIRTYIKEQCGDKCVSPANPDKVGLAVYSSPVTDANPIQIQVNQVTAAPSI